MAKKTKAKKKKRVKIPSDYEKIERIWAEHGVVRVTLKSGAQRSLSVRDAAIRARQLNAMPIPEWHRAGLQKLIAKIVEVCREAQHQIERGDKKAVHLNNMYTGKTSDGRPIDEVVSEDQKIRMFQMQYHTLTAQEISAIIRDDRLTEEHRHLVMRKTHSERIARGEDPATTLLGPDGRPVPTA